MSFKQLREDKVYRLHAEKWFWVCNLPIIVIVYLILPDVWNKISVLYLLLLSLQTQIRTVEGDAHAAEANRN